MTSWAVSRFNACLRMGCEALVRLSVDCFRSCGASARHTTEEPPLVYPSCDEELELLSDSDDSSPSYASN